MSASDQLKQARLVQAINHERGMASTFEFQYPLLYSWSKQLTVNRLGMRRRKAACRLAAHKTIIRVDSSDAKPSQSLTQTQRRNGQSVRVKRTHVLNLAYLTAIASWTPLFRSLRNESILSMTMMRGCSPVPLVTLAQPFVWADHLPCEHVLVSQGGSADLELRSASC